MRLSHRQLLKQLSFKEGNTEPFVDTTIFQPWKWQKFATLKAISMCKVDLVENNTPP